jgi:hypothetical protein
MFQQSIITLKILVLHLAMVGIAWSLRMKIYFVLVSVRNDQIQKNQWLVLSHIR